MRMLLDPVNYLKPHLIKDEVLTYKIEPYSTGHDSWGYRNTTVPPNADIVAIGDSLTYGVSATADNSWPSILQRLTQKTVYNLSLGGYGPVEYYYLLQNFALQLKPSVIIVGFYYGNDILNSYNTVYGNDYWRYLRNPFLTTEINSPLRGTEIIWEDVKFLQSFRDWLAHRSLLYRWVTFSAGDVYRFLEMKYHYGDKHSNITILEAAGSRIYTGFIPQDIFIAINLDDRKVQEGLRISLKMFSAMNKICETNGIRLLVVLIPTKENVFEKYIAIDQNLKNGHILNDVLKNELALDSVVKKEFNKNGILYIDPLEPLRNAVERKQIYFSNEDGHPNKYGYEIIASTINQFLQQSSSRSANGINRF